MSKWRPSNLNCLYVIPDIHGADKLLNMILKRILPLRKSDGGQDKIIFLGDYIDRGKDGHKVIDQLIKLKKKYKENVICLIGNHELMLLESLGYLDCSSPSSTFEMWISNGGIFTVLGYMERAGISDNSLDLSKSRIKDIIPKEHIDFMMHELDASYEEENFVFVHGGCQPDESPDEYDVSTIVWDRSLFKFVLNLISEDKKIPWENKVIITGHNNCGGTPIIRDKFMMLDCGSPKKLLAIEARSREAFMAMPGKSKLVRFDLKDTILSKSTKKSVFRRVSN